MAGPVEVRGTVRLRGVNPFLWVNAGTARRLHDGWRRPMPVRFSLVGSNAGDWPVNLMPAGGGRFYLYLNGTVRDACSVRVGDHVRARIRFDATYRGGPIHPMPAEFQAGLARSVRARRGWDALPPSRQKEILRYLAALKTPESQRRNVVRALRALRGERVRFLGRAWGGGVHGTRSPGAVPEPLRA